MSWYPALYLWHLNVFILPLNPPTQYIQSGESSHQFWMLYAVSVNSNINICFGEININYWWFWLIQPDKRSNRWYMHLVGAPTLLALRTEIGIFREIYCRVKFKQYDGVGIQFRSPYWTRKANKNKMNCLSKRSFNNKFVSRRHHSFFDTDKEITT